MTSLEVLERLKAIFIVADCDEWHYGKEKFEVRMTVDLLTRMEENAMLQLAVAPWFDVKANYNL